MGERQIEMAPVITDEDIRIVAKLGEIIWDETFTGILTRGQIEYMLENFQSVQAVTDQIRNKGYAYYLAKIDGVPVGYTGVQAENGRLMLSKIYTLKRCHGTGLADVMFDTIYEVARTRGCGVVWLTVNRHNVRAIAAYKKRGFTVTREQVADIGGGYVMDDYVMERAVEKT